jgi:diguanylate cyclase (GGDEF)-like protein
MPAPDSHPLLRALADVVRATASDLDPLKIIDLALDRARSSFRLRALLFLYADPDQGILRIERTLGEGLGALRGRTVAIHEGVAGRAVQTRAPLWVPRPGEGHAIAATELPVSFRASAILALPLFSRGRLVAVAEAILPSGARPLRPRAQAMLSLLLEPAAVALHNAVLLRRSEDLSVTDDLTKLYNSRYLNAMLRREVERSRRYRTPVSLIFLDLDGFKDVNDRHGHLWGSRTLVEVGEVIRATVREIDVVSRYGGDEFTVILPQTGSEGAFTIAERIRQRIAETPFLEGHGRRVRITASLGIATFPDHGRTKDDLIARADQAMYVAKGQGKNGVVLAESLPASPLAAAGGRS